MSFLSSKPPSHFMQRKSQSPHHALHSPACQDLVTLWPPPCLPLSPHSSLPGILVSLQLPGRSCLTRPASGLYPEATFTLRPPLTVLLKLQCLPPPSTPVSALGVDFSTGPTSKPTPFIGACTGHALPIGSFSLSLLSKWKFETKSKHMGNHRITW